MSWLCPLRSLLQRVKPLLKCLRSWVLHAPPVDRILPFHLSRANGTDVAYSSGRAAEARDTSGSSIQDSLTYLHNRMRFVERSKGGQARFRHAKSQLARLSGISRRTSVWTGGKRRGARPCGNTFLCRVGFFFG